MAEFFRWPRKKINRKIEIPIYLMVVLPKLFYNFETSINVTL
jgi:hypothetical protein